MEKEVKKSKRFPAFVIYITALYIIFFIFNYLTSESTECITDNWCISSKADIWIYSFFQTLGIVIVFFAALFGIAIAKRMLASKYRRILFAGFFLFLAATGLFAYLKFVPAEDKMEFIHIPIIIGVFLVIAAGGLFVKRKKPKNNRDLHPNKSN